MDLRILLFCFFFFIANSDAGFGQNNKNIFYGHSSTFESAPVSYQSFVNFDKYSSSNHNSVQVQSSQLNDTVASPRSGGNLFKPADFADQVAYREEVELAHRVALTKRHNNTDAAYVEAYTEAIKAQRSVGSALDNKRYISHRQQIQNQFGLNPEQSQTQPQSHSPSQPKNNYYFQTQCEGEGKREYKNHFLANNHHHHRQYDLRKNVGYVVVPDYEFNVNGVVHRQPPQNVAETSRIQFPSVPLTAAAAAVESEHGTSAAINYYA